MIINDLTSASIETSKWRAVVTQNICSHYATVSLLQHRVQRLRFTIRPRTVTVDKQD